MKRTSLLLVALLALVAAACSSEQPGASTAAQSQAAATPTPQPSSQAAEPSTAPESQGSSGSGTALADILPDDLNGAARTDLPGMEAILGPALAGQGIDASEVEFVFATYGEGTDAVTVNAFRIPGMSQVDLESFGPLMANFDTEGQANAETVDLGGKSVLRFSGTEGQTGAAYLYFADGAMFTVVSESEDLAGQLLSELP